MHSAAQYVVGQRFDAIVTGGNANGAWVRVFAPPADGTLQGDVAGLAIGARLRVKLVCTNVERGFIDFVVAA